MPADSGAPFREFSVVVLGAGGVGKSALTLRFMKGYFVEDYDPTIEESYRRMVTVDNETSMLEVLDTAGAEQFTALNEFYIKSGKGFILVFSLDQESGVADVQNLRDQILRIKGGPVPIVVVGTKSDLAEERVISRETMARMSTAWGTPIYETSAKLNWHVDDAFEDLVRQMRIRYPAPARRAKGHHAHHHHHHNHHNNKHVKDRVGDKDDKGEKCLAM